ETVTIHHPLIPAYEAVDCTLSGPSTCRVQRDDDADLASLTPLPLCPSPTPAVPSIHMARGPRHATTARNYPSCWSSTSPRTPKALVTPLPAQVSAIHIPGRPPSLHSVEG